MNTKYQDDFAAQKLSVVRFVGTLFFAASLIGWIVAVVILFAYSADQFRSATLVNLAISTVLLLLLGYLRFRLIKQNYPLAFTFIAVITSLVGFYTMLVGGTATAVGLILICLTIISCGIVLGINTAKNYGAASSVIIFGIFLVHNFQLVQQSPSNTSSTLLTTLVIIMFIAIVINIVRLGYSEITNSYLKAKEYAAKLEKLNSELDETVRLRTAQLAESYKLQADSVYNAAVMGMITKPMLHDLATPLSSLRGMFDLVHNDSQMKLEVMEMGKQSVEQIVRIVEHGKELMSGRTKFSEFSPYQILNTAKSVMQNELDKNGIEMVIDISPKISIMGISSAFERIILNLLLNAIEELKQNPNKKKRLIQISGTKQGKFFVLKIRDNGRGIPAEFISQIYEPNFSSKNENLGFGLAFVRETTESVFGGKIEVDTKPNTYTEFTLYLNLINAQSIPK